MGDLAKKLGNYLSKLGNKCQAYAEKMYFEQFKMEFGERDDDVYIVTYPKSGTTLMQMLLYHLTTDGDMSFPHIYSVSPWIRNDSYRKMKPRKLPSPRLIKTHDKYSFFSKDTKGRFVFVYRNGMDVAVSQYHQNKNYNNPKLKFESYLKVFFKQKAWFKYCQAWFKNKNKFNIIYIRYEDLLLDKRGEIEKLSKFLGISPTEQQIENAIKYSSFEYMKDHEDKFGDKEPEVKKIYDQFIRKGQKGEGRSMFDQTQKSLYEADYAKYLQKLERKIFKQS